MYDADVVELINLIRTASASGDTFDKIFVGADGVLSAWANMNDTNGKPLYPELEKWRGRVGGGANAVPEGQPVSQRPTEQERRSAGHSAEPVAEPEATASDPNPEELEKIKRRRSHL